MITILIHNSQSIIMITDIVTVQSSRVKTLFIQLTTNYANDTNYLAIGISAIREIRSH